MTGNISSLNLGILMNSVSPAHGGVFPAVYLPALEMPNAGIQPHVYGLRDAEYEAHKDKWKSTPVSVFPTVGTPRLGYSPELRDCVLASPHDVLHLHGIWQYTSRIMNLWRCKWEAPTVISPHGMLNPWAAKSSAISKMIARKLYEDENLAQATVIHALAPSEAKAMRDVGIKNPIATIPNAVHLPDLNQVWSPPSWDKTDRKSLLYLGRIHPIKGLGELIKAWKYVAENAPEVSKNWQIIIAGWDDGGHLPALISARDTFGLTDDIQFVGPLYNEDKYRAYAHASAFVLPSFSEGLPMSVLEAWSWKLPSFITPECNLPTNGTAVEISNSSEALGATLADILDKPSKLVELGNAAYAEVEKKYTWPHIVQNMRKMYDWAEGGKTTPQFIEC